MKLSIAMDTRSPIDAASGVAKLSGFTLYLFDNKITATNTKSAGRNENIQKLEVLDMH